MICPFLSNVSNPKSDSNNLYPCIGSCALYSGKDCYLKLMAQAQIDIANNINKNNG